jgi:hypothetical protein
MSGGRRDVEDDLRHQLSRDAVIGEKQLRRSSSSSVDNVLDYLVSRAYGSPDRLLDARDLLGQQDQGARALLLREPRGGQPTRSRQRIRGRSHHPTLRGRDAAPLMTG